jgi:geranylgeranyl pyrophosphate synthase
MDAVDEGLAETFSGGTPGLLSDTVRDVIATGAPPVFGGITLTVADALGGQNSFDRARPAAVALEAVRLQNAVHTGRLTPSPNASLGDTQAVLAGDFLYASAVETVLSADVDCATRQRTLKALLAAVRETTEGWARRTQHERRDDISVSSYLSAVRATTGAVGAGAARLGGLAAGADDTLVADAAAYGRAVGVAVGIHDDACAVLDDSSPLAHTYRTPPVHTLATIHAREGGVPVDRLQLFDRDIDELHDALRRSGSLAYTTQQLHDRAKTATAALGTFPDTSATSALRALAAVPADRFG